MKFGNLFTRGESPSKTTVPLHVIAEIIKASTGKLEQTGNSLIFTSRYGKTRIDVKSVHSTTADGQEVSDVVSICTELSKQLASVIETPMIVFFNSMAALGALISEPDSGQLFVVSRLSVFKGDDDAWKLYVPLIAFGALLQADALIDAIKRNMGLEYVQQDLPQRDDPSRWSENDFKIASEHLNRVGILSTMSSDGLTGEIPLKSGGISAIRGDETSLLTFQANMPHPALGNGLFYKLEFPFKLAKDSLITLVNKLNKNEVKSVDSPPFFGAWCSQITSGRIAHVGFWPNFLYQPGTVLNIAVWMIHRNRLALEFIGQNNR